MFSLLSRRVSLALSWNISWAEPEQVSRDPFRAHIDPRSFLARDI